MPRLTGRGGSRRAAGLPESGAPARLPAHFDVGQRSCRAPHPPLCPRRPPPPIGMRTGADPRAPPAARASLVRTARGPKGKS